MRGRRRDLARFSPTRFVAKQEPRVLDLDGGERDPVSQEISRMVSNLPTGMYRTQVTVCRIEFDSKGLEASLGVVTSYAFDFESKPRALEASAGAPPEGPDAWEWGVCDVCGELIAGSGKRHKSCDEGKSDET